MMEINGRTYRLCLLDTNVLSEMLKHPRGEFREFLVRFLTTGYFPAIAPFTIFELRRHTDLFDLFLNHFSQVPSVMLKGHEQLIMEELASYPEPSRIDPVLLSPLCPTPPAGWSRRRSLEYCFSTDFFLERERYWNTGKAEILAGILDLVGNFPPRHGKYSPRMIRQFVEVNVVQQVAMRDADAVRRIRERTGTFDPMAFPSVRVTALTVFFKFYPDDRRPSESDVFDVVISAPVPYVEAVITERHQAEVLRKAKVVEPSIRNLQIHTLAVLRN